MNAVGARTLLWGLLAAALVGCKGGNPGSFRLQKLVERLFGPNPSQQVRMAFDPDDPDNRRQGIVLLSKNKWGRQEPYLKGYATLLRDDEDELVRSAALRALGKSRATGYIKEVVAALSDESDSVRWDAAVALDQIIGDEAVGPLRRRAVGDVSVDVRTASAKALRHYRREDVVETLVRCLYDPAFGVRYRARQSLVALTGKDFGYDPEDWAPVVSGKLPIRQPAEAAKPKKPWWDWLGVTRRKRPETPQTQPAGKP